MFEKNLVLKIGGEPDPKRDQDIVELVVETRIGRPASLTLKLDAFHEETLEFKHLDDSSLAPGATVEVGFADQGGGQETLFTGEITALRPELGEADSVFVIEAKSALHKLDRNRVYKSFEQMKDSDIARVILSGMGVKQRADATAIVYPRVLQNFETNLQFLTRRAERIGFELAEEGQTLLFRKRPELKGPVDVLRYGQDLLRFAPRATAIRAAKEVQVRSYDRKTKKGIVGKGVVAAPGTPAAPLFDVNAAAPSTATSRPSISQDDATAEATALAQALGRAAVSGEGACFGNPAVQAGSVVDIQEVGKRFSGLYRIAWARHVIKRGHDYRTEFAVGEEAPDLRSKQGARGVRPALVTAVKDDPEKLGRVKVRFPDLPEEKGPEESWARVAAPGAGKERGLCLVPEIDDEVLVAFENEDPERPYILGGLWNEMDKAPLGADAIDGVGKILKRLLKSRSGHTIELDDNEDSARIAITDNTGKNTIVIDSKTNTITIASAGNLNLTAGGRVKVDCQGFEVDSKGPVSIKSAGITEIVASGGDLSMKGNAVSIKNNVSAVLAMAGPTVNVNNGALEVI